MKEISNTAVTDLFYMTVRSQSKYTIRAIIQRNLLDLLAIVLISGESLFSLRQSRLKDGVQCLGESAMLLLHYASLRARAEVA
jgi:hypothetical protein